MLLFSPRWLFLPGIVLMALGGIIGLWLLPGPRMLGGIELDVHTLLYCAMAILIGFQATCFAVLANTYAIDQGLLGEDSRIWSASRRVTLELGLTVGAGLVIAGFASSVAALWDWREQSFGHLDPRQMLRAVIPSALALTLGCQIALSSFFQHPRPASYSTNASSGAGASGGGSGQVISRLGLPSRLIITARSL